MSFPTSPPPGGGEKKKKREKSLFAALLPLRIQPLPVAPFPAEDSRTAQPEASAGVQVATGRDFANSHAKLFTGIGSPKYLPKRQGKKNGMLNCNALVSGLEK